MIRPDSAENTRTWAPAARILLGLAFVVIGIFLIDLAFDSMSRGRPITRAWVAGVAGLLLLVPGVAVTGQGIISAFDDLRHQSKPPNGPPPLKFS